MKLQRLLDGIARVNRDMEISSITANSKQVKEGCLFVCIKGKNFDGHNVAKEMLENGAKVIVCEYDLGLQNQIVVDNTRKAYSQICANWFDRPDRKLKIIGVTGTNGKTTVTTILKNVLTGLGYKAGLIGTSQYEINDQILPAIRTTPEPFELFELLHKMLEKNCEYVVMEVSSQGLEQYRLGTMQFLIAIFTNLTQDHLDVHGNMENYYQAKKMIFNMCDIALINCDDEYGRRYLEEVYCPKYSYSINNMANYYTDVVKLKSTGISYWMSDNIRSYRVDFPMIGRFNVSNTLAVMACCNELGFDMYKVIDIISRFKGVKGRAEVIPTGQDFTVICDYAHTDDALENILSSVKSFTEGRLICVFGCGGNRDKVKRPLMANAASKYSDFLVVTSDNPRDEDPVEIIKDILVDLKDSNIPHVSIPDRKEAIAYSINMAEKGDVIVLAGKGHENYQVIENDVHIHLDEREVVAECLKKLDESI